MEKRKEPSARLACRKNLPKLVTNHGKQNFNFPALVSPAILTPSAINLTPTQLLGGIKWLDIDANAVASTSVQINYNKNFNEFILREK